MSDVGVSLNGQQESAVSSVNSVDGKLTTIENQLKSPDPCWESHYYEWILEVMATLTHTTTENQLREEQDE